MSKSTYRRETNGILSGRVSARELSENLSNRNIKPGIWFPTKVSGPRISASSKRRFRPGVLYYLLISIWKPLMHYALLHNNNIIIKKRNRHYNLSLLYTDVLYNTTDNSNTARHAHAIFRVIFVINTRSRRRRNLRGRETGVKKKEKKK